MIVLQINDNIRISEYDDIQYVVEKRCKKSPKKAQKQEYTWKAHGYYCGLGPMTRAIGSVIANEAYSAALNKFLASPYPDAIKGLPKRLKRDKDAVGQNDSS